MKAIESKQSGGQDSEAAPESLERLVRAAEAAGASDLRLQMRGKTVAVQ